MNYTERISSYWPEFGQNGKENITVADLMRHEAGLPIFHPHLLHVEDTLTGEEGNHQCQLLLRVKYFFREYQEECDRLSD